VSAKFLRRYTDLPALIYLLSERKITLLDPQAWDDSNDSYYLGLYEKKKNLKRVLAVCFTQTRETYQHWRVFAGGSSGACIRFRRRQLIDAMNSRYSLKAKSVRYLTLLEIRRIQMKTEDLPFLKRYPFGQEKEFRIIYESQSEEREKLDIPIPLSCIHRITLSPWMHPSIFGHVKRTIKSIQGCDTLNVVRSTLIGNQQWKKLGESAK
jgi:hypothetical protein